MIYVVTFIIIVITKFILNIRRYFLCERYLNLFFAWLKDECKINLLEKQALVKKLVIDAGYGKGTVPHTELAGYGQIAAFNVNPMDAFPNNYKHVAHGIIANLTSAKGVYKQRAFDSLNPVFWIEFVIFLPRNILSYLGLSQGGVIIKLSNVIWWIFGTVITSAVLNAYSPELSESIRNIFK